MPKSSRLRSIPVVLLILLGSCTTRSELRSEARLAYADGHFVEAIFLADGLLKKEPRNVEMLALRGRSWMEVGQYGKAQDDVHRVFELSKDSAVLFYAGLCANGLKDYRRAEREFSAVIAFDSTIMDAWRERGRARLAMGSYVLAAEDLKVYLSSHEKDFDARNDLRQCYQGMGVSDTLLQ